MMNYLVLRINVVPVNGRMRCVYNGENNKLCRVVVNGKEGLEALRKRYMEYYNAMICMRYMELKTFVIG